MASSRQVIGSAARHIDITSSQHRADRLFSCGSSGGKQLPKRAARLCGHTHTTAWRSSPMYGGFANQCSEVSSQLSEVPSSYSSCAVVSQYPRAASPQGVAA